MSAECWLLPVKGRFMLLLDPEGLLAVLIWVLAERTELRRAGKRAGKAGVHEGERKTTVVECWDCGTGLAAEQGVFSFDRSLKESRYRSRGGRGE